MDRPRKLISKIHQLVVNEEGRALVELAIMAPFLAVMLAGVAEFGRFFRNYTTLDKATRSASRYLSSHQLNSAEINRATNLVVCGKLACAGGDELVPGISSSNVCLESAGSPKVTTVTARIVRTSGDCNPMANAPANPVPYNYQPIFNIGALIGSDTFSLALPISPSTTMYYIVNN